MPRTSHRFTRLSSRARSDRTTGRAARRHARKTPRVWQLFASIATLALLAGVVQLLPAGADSVTIRQRASHEDSGLVDLNRDGAADYARYGVKNRALSIGEQPGDGADLRLVLPFNVSAEALAAIADGGTANVAFRVGRLSHLGGERLIADTFAGGATSKKTDYTRAASTSVVLTPIVGRVAIDVTRALRLMDGDPGTLTVRLRLDRLAVEADGRETQVSVPTSEATDSARWPMLTVTTSSEPSPPVVPTTPTPIPTAPTPTPTTPTPTSPPPAPPSPPGSAQPPSAVTAGQAWDVVFRDEFSSAAETAAKWDNGMRSGAKTLEGNTELQWYVPENSVVTTDSDGATPVSVLRQDVRHETTGSFYTVRTLCRLYPAEQYPQYYNPAVNNACTDSNTAKTLVPYQYTSGMLNNANSFGYRYGYLEARVKMPKGWGLWSALWLRDWQPHSYEIDVMEGFDRNARLMRATHWYPGGHLGSNNSGGDIGLLKTGGQCRGWSPTPATIATPGRCSVENSVDLSQGYHTIGFNWTPTKYEYYLDGVKFFESKSAGEVDQAYNHLILNLALGNNEGGWDWLGAGVRKPLEASLTDSSVFAKPSVEWDYVRVWQAPGSHDVCTTGSCPG